MRHIILLAVLVSVFACSSPEDKAKDLIKAHLSTTMKDFDSYEPVEYGKIDSAFSSYLEDRYYQALYNWNSKVFDTLILCKENETAAMYENSGKSVDSLQRLVKIYDARRDSLNEVITNMKTSYKGSFNGWSIRHKFRGKNSYGAKVLNTYRFTFNKAMDTLTGSSICG